MKPRRYTLVGIITLALVLVGGMVALLKAQAGEKRPIDRGQNPGVSASPDLIVSKVEVLTLTSSRLDYRFVIQNIGEVTADLDGNEGPVLFGTALSTDIYYDTAEKAAGSFPITQFEITELGVGEKFTVTHYANPTGVNMFDYDYFIVKINIVPSRLEEISYTNNEGYAPIPKPDLIVPSIQVLSIHSSNVEFQVEVENIGGHVADLSNVNFQAFLSVDDELGYGDKAVGGWPISPPAELLPGETMTKTFSGGTPGTDFQMYHYLIGIIDYNSALQESDEGNNQGEGEIPCFIFLPMTIQP